MILVATLACAQAELDGTTTPGGGRGGHNNNQGGQGGYVSPLPGPLPCANDLCDDFPAAPIVEAGVPSNAAEMFPGDPSGNGPCILEPEEGSLFPSNWLRPRVRVSGSGLYQIRVTVPRQKNPLVVYTNQNTWAIPKSIWQAISQHNRGDDVTVQVRAAGGGASTTKFTIAFVEASGSMVYWAAKPAEVGKGPEVAGVENDSELRGFAVGDETTASALKISEVKQPSRDQGGNDRAVKCIGCHVATPDGQYVAFTDHWPWNSVIAGVKPDVRGQQLAGLSGGGLSALNRPWGGMMAFSLQHWSPGDRIMVVASSLQNPMTPWIADNAARAELLWYDMDAAAPMDPRFTQADVQFGKLARNGDTGGAAMPSWSNDGLTILYSSSQGGNLDGRLEKGTTDLYTVPYNGRKGGDAKPVPGASTAEREEYYPDWSPDGRLIAYNAAPAGERMYANPNAELHVVEPKTGTSVRLRANDPPACSGKKSPGINNHWGRWSPQVQVTGGSIYYWLIFSSNRSDIPAVQSLHRNPAMPNGSRVEVTQLYITAVVQEETGQLLTFPAIYLWNQSTDTLNTTPAWEAFQIPPAE
jgi:hypothetical protein